MHSILPCSLSKTQKKERNRAQVDEETQKQIIHPKRRGKIRKDPSSHGFDGIGFLIDNFVSSLTSVPLKKGHETKICKERER
ncbi:hypothetical protein I3842_05G129400 [Carya illinoinensis]|uniref:Uncharacterized protein n=1 Tax=Carya illinoinensis TaxID=32201 RepID=A0A922F0H0_CARIL|nr:hypothetical protein I3842_05G129400 [Carya illinoinensis]